ncbi:MAG: hypothetical protein IMF02_10165 [Proteobacteria bacterium]|nr:hypothetical protein [Pseudomonadota bacterium]
MFKKLAGKIFSKASSHTSSDGFFLDVRCSECNDKFHLFIHKSWELSQNFKEDGSVTYFFKKMVFGVGCPNRIHVEMQFDSAKNLISRQIENGEFIDD